MNINGREEYAIAKALSVASQVLRARKDPPFGDIETMELLIDRFFPDYKKIFLIEETVKKAISRGMVIGKGKLDLKTMNEWIESHPGNDTVVEIFKKD